MSKLQLFEIKLENPGQPILTGGVVRGDVMLRLKKEIDIARIMVHLFGAGQVEFQDVQGSVASRSSCEDSETFLRLSQIVYNKNSPNVRRLTHGELYKCTFEFHLTRDLPSSFMTVIFYKLTAFIDCGGKSHEVTLPIVVINDLDLANYRGRLCLNDPIESWSPCRARTDSGLVSVHLVATKRGYTFGDTISLQIEVFNNSKAKLDNVSACLVQKGILKAFSSSGAQYRRVQRLLVKYVSIGKLRGADRIQLENVEIKVPWVVTSDIERFTRLIEIEYYIQITTSTQMLSAVTGAPVSQIVCIGPDYRKTEMVSVLCEEQIAIGVRDRRDQAAGLQQQQQQQQQLQQLYPNLNGNSAMPSAPPPEGSDLAMFTMLPTAPPSYDEALTHQKAPFAAAAGDQSFGDGDD